jgi:hypothetical protein
MDGISQTKTSDSRRELERRVQDLFVTHSKEIYKLKGEMRKRDLFMSELENKVNSFVI